MLYPAWPMYTSPRPRPHMVRAKRCLITLRKLLALGAA